MPEPQESRLQLLDHLILTVHDGKGQKDRTVPLPEMLVAELQAQLATVMTSHDEDLAPT